MFEFKSVIATLPESGLNGRRKIMTDKREITIDNVAEVMSKAWSTHQINASEAQYLYDVYRGKQDIRNREKEIRPEICNVIVVNRANEIVTFKTSYLLGEPLQYVSRGGDEALAAKINILNDYMYSEAKAAKDKEIADWLHICGVAPRMVLYDPLGEEEGSPASIYTLDPREAGCIYHSGVGHKRLAGFIRQRDEDGQYKMCVYTPTEYFEIKGDDIITHEVHTYGSVPIVEYVHNEARLGAFEIVLPILNAINTLQSNRLDDIEQFVQSILVFENCAIDQDTAKQLKEKLGLMIKSDPSNPAKVYRIDGQLDQNGAQTIVDDLTDAYITICGMPNRNGGSSTSDTGAAVIMRDGWSAAESRAKDTGTLFERSEREFLRVFFKICSDVGKLDLSIADVGMKFTRQNYADIQSKAQVLAEMLNNDKIHPKLAFQHCGMFTDSEDAYRVSMEWYEQRQAEEQRRLEEEMEREREAISTERQGDISSEQADS